MNQEILHLIVVIMYNNNIVLEQLLNVFILLNQESAKLCSKLGCW